MWNAAPPLTMTDEQRRTIEAWHRASNTPQGIALRAKIVLLAADGAANNRIAMELAKIDGAQSAYSTILNGRPL